MLVILVKLVMFNTWFRVRSCSY